MTAIVIKKVNTRLESHTASRKLLPLLPGTAIKVRRLEWGEKYRGSHLWLVDESENKYWAGAFDWKAASASLVKSAAFTDFSIQEMWNYSLGEGVTIGLIDCGINPNHRCLQKTRLNILNPGSGTCMHGTFMSSICGGSDGKEGVLGIAPSAVLLFTAFQNVETLKPGELQQCLESLQAADVISMSFSLLDRDYRIDRPAGRALQSFINEIARDKVLVAAAGNLGGIDTKYYPAAYDNVVSVSGYMSTNFSLVHNDANFWNGVQLAGPFESYFDRSPQLEALFPMTLSYDGTSSTTSFTSALFALVIARLKKRGVAINKTVLLDACCVPTTIFSQRSQTSYSVFRIDKNKILQTLKT